MPGIAPYSVGSHALPRASSGVPAERGPALAARETGAGMGVLLRPSASSPSSLSERTAPGDGVASRDVARNGAGCREAERCPASPLPGAGKLRAGRRHLPVDASSLPVEHLPVEHLPVVVWVQVVLEPRRRAHLRRRLATRRRRPDRGGRRSSILGGRHPSPATSIPPGRSSRLLVPAGRGGGVWSAAGDVCRRR